MYFWDCLEERTRYEELKATQNSGLEARDLEPRMVDIIPNNDLPEDEDFSD